MSRSNFNCLRNSGGVRDISTSANATGAGCGCAKDTLIFELSQMASRTGVMSCVKTCRQRPHHLGEEVRGVEGVCGGGGGVQ